MSVVPGYRVHRQPRRDRGARLVLEDKVLSKQIACVAQRTRARMPDMRQGVNSSRVTSLAYGARCCAVSTVRSFPIWVVGFALAWAFPAYAAALPWEVWSGPSALTRLDAREQVLERSSYCPGGCRYDRDGPGPEGLLANPHPDRSLYRGTGGEQIVFDDHGPGAVTRIWMTSGMGVSSCLDPAIRVRFYVDGAAVPTLDLPLHKLFDGSTPPFVPGLVRDRAGSSGGFVSYVPVTYAQGLRIALSDVAGTPNPCTGNADHLLWYQFTYHRLPPGTAVTSFTPQASFGALASWFAASGFDPWNGLLALQPATPVLAPGQTVVLTQRSGSGWLRGLRLKLPRSDWPYLRLRVSIDGEDAVDLPLERFFATASDATVAARAPLLGEDADGWLYSWLPMPYRGSLRVELSATAQLPGPVAVDAAMALDGAAVPSDAGAFFAETTAGCGNGQVTMLSRRGAGRLVGVSSRFRSDTGPTLAYLEGDERIRIDGAVSPQWYGTGLEDFFNAGFYFDQGAFVTPWAGASRLDATGAQETRVWRWLATDSLSWQNAVDWQLETGHAPNLLTPMCHDSVVYGYARAQPALVRYREWQAGDAGHVLPAGAVCPAATGFYADEPPTPRTAQDCRYVSGSSLLQWRPQSMALPLRLRRTAFAAAASAPADILLDGVVVGHLPFLRADPLRQWAEQDVVLSIAQPAAQYTLEIRPRFDAPGNAGGFSESAWALWGGWVDGIFADGFDLSP